ncbi:hypothetical protein QFZ20_004441 [Flavobacterium sp. W4I14]|nr:hypothetical protein [Flavobacterium sp. W4I14]
MRISNKMRGIVRTVLSFLLLYSFIKVFCENVIIKFNDPTEVVLGRICGAAIVLWLSVSMFLNGLSELRSRKIKYKTYFASIISSITFGYFLIEEILDRKDILVIIFGALVMLSFGYLAVYDFLYFRKIDKDNRIDDQLLSKPHEL